MNAVTHAVDTVIPRTLPVAAAAPADPMAMIAHAVAHGASVEQISQLMDLRDRHEANEARKAFVAAMAEFKKNPPRITKDKAVGYENKDGSFTGYRHATLAAVCDAAISGLAKVGISHRWDLERQEGGRVVVTCVLTHRDGHSQSTVLDAAPDDSGKKNAIQQTGSTITYLQRYTLLSATGLATDEQDDDGRAAGAVKPAAVEPEGYQAWLADLEAVADEGTDRLRAAFQKSPMALRKHLTDVDGAVWAQIKDRAAAVQS